MLCLMSFDRHIYPCNPDFYQSIEYFYYPRRFPGDPSQSTLSPRLLCQVQPLSPYTSPACASLSCEGSKKCVFSVWLFSLNLKFSHAVPVATLCSFLLPSGIPLYEWSTVYSLSCPLTFGLFLIFSCYEECANEHSCTSLFVDICFYFSWINIQEWSCWII